MLVIINTKNESIRNTIRDCELYRISFWRAVACLRTVYDYTENSAGNAYLVTGQLSDDMLIIIKLKGYILLNVKLIDNSCNFYDKQVAPISSKTLEQINHICKNIRL